MLTPNSQSGHAVTADLAATMATTVKPEKVLQREYLLTLAALHYAQASRARLFDL